jgi:catechol 2,3-dioxygenase-like lactoylglutathione lyase family enzyme
MRLDHIAYRTSDRVKTAQFFIDAFGYKIQTEFDIDFPDGSKAKCIALEPPEKPKVENLHWLIRQYVGPAYLSNSDVDQTKFAEFHLPPEIFVSDGTPDSIVGKWVARRDNVGGVHHMAYQVDSVEKTMQEWKDKGYAEFSSDKPLTCPGLTQVFTKPSELTGVIYEFIERGEHGFCKDNVKDLMESTKNNK